MKITRFAVFAALVALVGSTVPAYATTATGTITVKWNTQASANVVLHTQYTTAFAHNGANAIITNAGTGAGQCTATDGNGTSADGTVDFNTVTPDSNVATGCMEEGGLIIGVTTSSSNWQLGMKDTSAAQWVGYDLCAYANNGATAGTKHGALPVVIGSISAAVPATAAVGAVVGTFGTCGADTGGTSGALVDSNAASALNNLVAAGSAAENTQAYIGLDLQLQINKNAGTGPHSTSTETVTLTAS